MEKNWLIIILVFIAVIAIIVFVIIRNHKDKKDLLRKFIDEENTALPKEPDNETDSTD